MTLTFNEKAHRYKMSDAEGKLLPVTGATTLLGGGIPKPALVYWAGKMVAEFVAENPLEVERLRGTEDMVRELAKVPNKVRDRAAVRGSEIHAIAEKYVNGEEVEVPEEHLAEVQGYVEFLEAWEFEVVLAEKSCGNRTNWHAGRFDVLGRSPHLAGGRLVMVDLKTSNHVYGETALQTAAYAKSEFYVDDEAPDVEHPFPEVAATYVAHITPGGTDLHVLCRDEAEIDKAYTMFLAAAYTHKTAKTRDGFLSEPLPCPTTTEQKAA